MKKRVIQVSVLVSAVLLFNGCGGGESATTPVTTTGTAFYVDSAVEGVTVTCGSIVSQTDRNGQFTYEEGKECTFSMGDIVLRREGGMYQDRVVIEDHIRTAQFLQSMDFDGDPENGISMHAETSDIMAQNGIVNVPETDQDLAEAVSYMENVNMGYQGAFVNEQDARDHLERTIQEHDGGEGPHDTH